ncbi:hypothetical protein K469DRAFT_712380 [Zopfia rhizophila CBS 207.26]|uniref:Uncharacterized protein n=1 Tax=Zopfia rhizophila CBS 207.26 TaxID=1314779 RepID=A0A6A6ES47_9PEZI|nr:hypothetical protein K469DRAFT_712380 [Zopfia rhizophila CBS 207.26]
MLFTELWKRDDVQIICGIPLVETMQELEEVVRYVGEGEGLETVVSELGPFHSRIGYLSLIIPNF